jgi:hypothetical protein
MSNKSKKALYLILSAKDQAAKEAGGDTPKQQD